LEPKKRQEIHRLREHGSTRLTKAVRMNVLDLTKATVICGLIAFLFYSYPVLGQVLAITFLSILWLSYARKTLRSIRGRRLI
jgi:uncharacterized membrane protein YesL